ncbi:copper homeostasis protein CutC [Arthrobacter sp. 35W]|uniref:copper homeostasis protein CutC n=1 Tax=Arthrobacter sp. 35W TaxID=1132441 RepID=UPI000421D3F3|nr:copper homeostasis protein CutC [Arthrobacter sp. 35W]
MQLEIAVQDAQGARLAQSLGADRVELCCALQLGGLTPSGGLLDSVLEAAPGLPVHVLIRPRPGDYVYDRDAVELMAREIRSVARSGATGVVIGALTADGALDTAVVERLLAEANGLHTTFHRAIDHLDDDDALAAVSTLAGLGFGRILSSGGALRAGDGVDRLGAMVKAASGRLSIMAGGGVDIADFPAFSAAGLKDVHLSAKAVRHHQGEARTSVGASDDPAYHITDEALVRSAVAGAAALP